MAKPMEETKKQEPVLAGFLSARSEAKGSKIVTKHPKTKTKWQI